jgi:hypothetical protein
MKERTLLSIKLIFSHILFLPFLLAISILLPSISICLDLLIQTLLIIIYFTGYWEFFGLRFRISYFVLIEFLLALLIFKRLHLPVNTSAGWPGILLFSILEAYLIYQLLNIFYVILKRNKDSLEISFPLKEGKILVTDGGNSRVSRLMNYHYYSKVHKRKGTNLSMIFATDIVRLDPPLKSFLPANNPDYPVFENLVYSPISGSVFKVINDIQDNIPYSGNYPYNTGNTIVIINADLYFLIGHLKIGSIIKKEGEQVGTGEMIAKVGNSGYTERPHIHMQLIRSKSDNYWFGRGVNITYRQINLYKNRIISA